MLAQQRLLSSEPYSRGFQVLYFTYVHTQLQRTLTYFLLSRMLSCSGGVTDLPDKIVGIPDPLTLCFSGNDTLHVHTTHA